MAKDACGWLLKKHQEKQRTFGKPAFKNLKTAVVFFSSTSFSHSRRLYLDFVESVCMPVYFIELTLIDQMLKDSH